MIWLKSESKKKREKFLNVAARLKSIEQEKITYEFQHLGKLPTPQRCDEVARFIEAQAEYQGVSLTANVRASGNDVFFLIKDSLGVPMYEKGTQITLAPLSSSDGSYKIAGV